MGDIANQILEKEGKKVEGAIPPANSGDNGGAPAASGEKSDAEKAEDIRVAQEKEEAEKKAAAQGNEGAAKTPEELEAERLAKENKAAPPAGSESTELSDEDFLALLKKKTGRDIKSLEELSQPAAVKTPEELEAEKTATRESAIQYGLKNKLFDSKQLAAYHVDATRSDRDIALEVFTTAQLKEDAALTSDQIEERFQELYAEDEATDNWRRLQKAKDMGYLAQQYRAYKHDAIISAEDKYNNYTSVTQKATAYKGFVEDAVSGFDKKLTFNIEGKDYFANVSDKTMLSIQEHLLNEDMFTRLGQGEVNATQITQILKQSVISKDLPKIIEEVARSYAAEMLEQAKLGRRNITPDREGGEENSNAPTDYQGVAKNLLAQHNAKKGG